MTIPYNARIPTLVSNIIAQLVVVDESSIPDNVEKTKLVLPKRKKKSDTDTSPVAIKIKYFSVNSDGTQPWVSHSDIFVLCTMIMDIIKNEFPRIKRLSDYLKSISKLCSKLNVPIVWNLPHGLVVVQSYLKQDSFEIKPFKTFKSFLTLSINSKKIDARKQSNALMPNLVHSLDSTTIVLLKYHIDKHTGKNTSMYTIHDCFAVTADQVMNLVILIRSIYTKLYSEERYIEHFDNSVINNLKAMYGDRIVIKDNGIHRNIEITLEGEIITDKIYHKD
jgi:hypothetical protein